MFLVIFLQLRSPIVGQLCISAFNQGVFSRIRSWSQENLNFSFWRRPASPEEDLGPQGSFQRGTVSLGHGPFRRSRRGRGSKRKVDANALPTMSGVLNVEGPDGEWKDRWCAVKDLNLFVHETPQDAKAMLSVSLPGCGVEATQADKAEDRVIQITQPGVEKPIMIKVGQRRRLF